MTLLSPARKECNSKHPPQCPMSEGGRLWQVTAPAVARDGSGVRVSEGWGSRKPWPPAPAAVHSPHPGQVHGPLLRLNHVSPADSGEYSCQVTGSSGTLEASVLVTIEAASPSPIPGERQEPRVGAGAQAWGPFLAWFLLFSRRVLALGSRKVPNQWGPRSHVASQRPGDRDPSQVNGTQPCQLLSSQRTS